MRKLMLKLWHDDHGALLATEWVFVSTIMVIGLVAGLKSVQQAVSTELEDFSNAIGSLSQAYAYSGSSGCNGAAQAAGTDFVDAKHTTNVTTNAGIYTFSAQDAGVCPD
jgi:Flp pilus assembly pilin Flp